jgi:hypothetical protein
VRLTLTTLEGKVRFLYNNAHWHPCTAPNAEKNITGDPIPPPEDHGTAIKSFVRLILRSTDKHGMTECIFRNIVPRIPVLDLYSDQSGMQMAVL